LNQRRPVLRVWRRDEEFLTFNCARCGWRGSVGGQHDHRDHRDRQTSMAQLGAIKAAPSPKLSDAERSARALELWSAASSLRRSLAEAYLSSRGLSLHEPVLIPDVLRFHASCPFGRERLPAMLALMRDIRTDEPRAIHRTALQQDGSGKAEPADGGSSKRMLGPAGGCAIKLIADEDVTLGLGIAEGIENALTAMSAGWSPVWAAGSKGSLAKFPVLPGIEALTLFTDPEPGGVEAARECARRWQESGREATILIPPSGDWNDVGKSR
jgi:hypothetical protein